MKLIYYFVVVFFFQSFINDSITSNCAIKRRCAASNVMEIVQHSRRPEVMGRHALFMALEIIAKDNSSDNIVGALGLLRLLVPFLLLQKNGENIIVPKVIEVIEYCLHLLNEEKSHTIINASLECLNGILCETNCKLKEYLVNDKLEHMNILRKRRTIKHQIQRGQINIKDSNTSRKTSFSSIQNMSQFNKDLITSSPIRSMKNEIESLKESKKFSSEDKLLTCSDNEFDATNNESLYSSRDDIQSQNSSVISLQSLESWKNQKSSDSIGSFFTSILSHHNADTVTKFFRVGSQGETSSASGSAVATVEMPKSKPNLRKEIDAVSLGSQISINSQNLSGLDEISKTDDLPGIEILTDRDIDAIRMESHADIIDYAINDETKRSQQIENDSFQRNDCPSRNIFIGYIGSQTMISYAVRLISSKYLLKGIPNELIDDGEVRVSIKNLSLIAIGHCIALCPSVLRMTLEQDNEIDAPISDDSDESGSLQDGSSTIEIIPNATMLTTKHDEVDIGEPLNIKDDHFGESSSSYYDFMFPLSKSADTILLAAKLKTTDDANAEQNEKLSANLYDLLSKSDIVGSSGVHSFGDDCAISSNTITSVENKSSKKFNVIRKNDGNELQLIKDILIFANHMDPTLRADIQTIAGNYIMEKMKNENYYHDSKEYLLNEKLFSILFDGLKSDLHVIIKQSLVTLKSIVAILLNISSTSFINGKSIKSDILRIFDAIIPISENKYWVVQNSYINCIASIDFAKLINVIDVDMTRKYKEIFILHIYDLLRCNDQRVRNTAADALVSLCMENLKEFPECNDAELLDYLIEERIFSNLPTPLCHISKMKNNQLSNKSLNECLFKLSNLLLELESKDQQFGVIRALGGLMQKFDPISYHKVWNELNLLEVIISLTTKFYSTGSDILCQCDLIPICTQLMISRYIDTYHNEKFEKCKELIDPLCDHNMKILCIYHTVLHKHRPVFISKGQKSDIFINSKELMLLNSRGYFGNDYFYLKIYKIIKVLNDSYKINVNNEIDEKFLTLLKVTLSSMAALLEIINTNGDMTTQIKLVEELLQYLPSFLHHAPVETIECVRHLLRYSFSWNFANRRNKYEEFLSNSLSNHDIFEKLRQFDVCDQPIKSSITNLNIVTSSPRTGQKILNALVSSKLNEDKPVHFGQGMIKLFETTVIQCLKLITKSDAIVQAAILRLICQVIALNVDYSLLDSKNLFMEFILKLLELVETGMVKYVNQYTNNNLFYSFVILFICRNSHCVVPPIIKYLFCLTKQKERKLTIPKIINAVDTLLANSLAKNGSHEALHELAFEFYFQHQQPSLDESRITSDSERIFLENELNTQQEVAFSMMLKFLHCENIQKMICLVLINEQKNTKDLKKELKVNIFNVFDDSREIFWNQNQLNLFNRLIEFICPIEDDKICLLMEKTFDMASRFSKEIMKYLYRFNFFIFTEHLSFHWSQFIGCKIMFTSNRKYKTKYHKITDKQNRNCNT